MEIRADRVDPRDDHLVFLVVDQYTGVSWNRSFHGGLQLHGHVHGRFDNSKLRRFDVGVDSIGADPIQEAMIIDEALKIDPLKFRESN